MGITDLANETQDIREFRWTDGTVIGSDSVRLPWRDENNIRMISTDSQILTADSDCVLIKQGSLVTGPCGLKARFVLQLIQCTVTLQQYHRSFSLCSCICEPIMKTPVTMKYLQAAVERPAVPTYNAFGSKGCMTTKKSIDSLIECASLCLQFEIKFCSGVYYVPQEKRCVLVHYTDMLVRTTRVSADPDNHKILKYVIQRQ